ncbi:MAG: DUF4080 domain-containing protein, partial [Clostridia bacterium]|nr:DUF4080 domain-containing protein [Clostridia bacterium]
LHGSPMREQPQRYPCSFCNEAPYEVLETPWITNGELKRLHKVEWALDKLYNSGRFSDSLQYVLQTTDITPFDFFLQFGEWAGSPAGVSLARVAELFMEFCLLQSGVEKDLLRNAMVCDWLSSVCGGKLPLFLQVKDVILGEFRKRLRKDELLAPKPGIPRGAALLYHPTRGVYVDYEFPHPVTGRYKLHFVAL